MAEIKGEVRIANGLVAKDVTFQLVRQRFGGEPELVATVVTNGAGQFTVPDVAVDSRATLVAKIQRDGADDVVLAPLTTAQDSSELRLVVPAAEVSFASEFQRLSDAVAPVLGGASLASAQENVSRKDLSLVHRESGWDARLVALAAMSSRLSQPSENQAPTGLDEQTVYGLLRAGLPSSRTLLARVPSETVRAALEKSAAAGVIDLDEGGRAEAVGAFERFAAEERLASHPAGGPSTLGELLDASGLSTEGDEESPRSRFQKALLDTTSTEPLWVRAAAAGLDDTTIGSLKTQAKLAFLTTNNAPLIAKLQPEVSQAESFGQALAAGRWDDAETWASVVTELGGKDAVPAGFHADDDPVQAYSAEVARRVRVAYPTQVVAAMVRRDELPIGIEPTLSEMVATTLQRAGDLGFRLGSTHTQTFLKDNAEVLEGIDAAVQPQVSAAVATLQRTYQLSPSNESMKVLIEQGLTSAYDIAALSEGSFIDRYSKFFPSEREARLVHRKSEQISAVLYNFHSMTKQAAASSGVAVVSGTTEQREEAVANIKRVLPPTPTMESLFGSMDYCECDHCRSVLGPAAYLVDLLKFLDPDSLVWDGFRADWAKRHNGAPYPFETPYGELMARRPDLAHLQLSCDNTNTELPVIDIVNEILEFLVANPTLTGDAAHDSGAVQSADVMSEPEFIIDTAYERLRTARYPSVLPFDVWHETVRGFLAWLDEPLASLIEILQSGSELEIGYAAAIERLGLTRAEADVITDPDPLSAWWTRFGYDAAPTQELVAIDSLRRAKQLARRLGVGYQDLAELLETHFINPSLDQLGVLSTAGVSVADAIDWRKNQPLIVAPEPDDAAAHELWRVVRSVQERLDAVTRTYSLQGDRAADAWLRSLPDGAFADVVVLLDPDSSCDFDRTVLGSAATSSPLDGAQLAQVVVKLDLFVRLRRTTKWSIADLDQALRAFVPGGTAGTSLFGKPLSSALVYLGRVSELESVLGTDGGDRRRFVSFWSDLTTSGPKPLYAELFLNRPVGQRDPSFAAPLGDALSAEAVGGEERKLARSHVPALQSGLGLRDHELKDIADRREDGWNELPLSLSTVSEMHRYAFVASAIGWSVADVLVLERLSGIDPFQPLVAGPLESSADDHPLHSTLAFIRIAKQFDQAGLAMSEIDYLLAHQVDPVNDMRPDAGQTAELLAATKSKLAEALARTATAPTEVDPPPGTPAPVPPPTPADITTALIAAAVGPRGGLVAALLQSKPSLTDPSSPAAEPVPLVDAFLGMAQPAADPARVSRAYLLLAKVLLVADRFDLTARECLEFGLDRLPLEPIEGAAPGFTDLAQLVSYASLRKEMGAGPDAIVDVIAAARGAATNPPPPPAERLSAAAAALAAATSRRIEVVSATVAAVGLDADDLTSTDGINRLWKVLVLIERLGVDAKSITGWLKIASPDTPLLERQAIARAVKDAVRSHLGPTRWRQVAKPVSDRLRQRQRDALAAIVMHENDLTSINELYQWLLIDPGAEPVLRTTRVRQAISSLQLFVQRCLLNIEPRVHPAALNAEHWEWMKRYRVWEANRKIFLYPENWLEAEFRDDKSHLFDELESTLLQSDVSADGVEDAFLVYLRKLDEIARLDVVGFYTEQDALDPGSTSLHVIGRTHGGPHQYYYRRLQHGMWTPWEPMGLDIEGDHIVPVVWRNRLHVFWVTFLQQSDDSASNPSSSDSIGRDRGIRLATGAVGASAASAYGFQIADLTSSNKPPNLAEATVSDVQRGTAKNGVSRRIDVQLHWSEYVRGKWSPATSGGFGRAPAHYVTGVFDPARVFVHASTLWDAGEEAGVQIHLSGGMTRTFLLRGRNSVPEPGSSTTQPTVPYNTPTPAINRYLGSSSLEVTFAQKLTSTDGGAPVPTQSTIGILGRCDGYAVLPSANGVAIGGGDIGSLVSPFFFQDARRTFFVEPSLLEITTETWEEWIVPDPDPGISYSPGDVAERVVVPYVPELFVPVGPDDDDPLFDPWEDLYTGIPEDIITAPDVAVLFGDTVLGARGGVDLTVFSALQRDGTAGILGEHELVGPVGIPVVTGRMNAATTEVLGNVGSRLDLDRVVVVDHRSLAGAGLSTDTDRLKVIGTSGFANARALRGFER